MKKKTKIDDEGRCTNLEKKRKRLPIRQPFTREKKNIGTPQPGWKKGEDTCDPGFFSRRSLEVINTRPLNAFTTGNPFLGTKLLGFSIGRGSGALKGVKSRAGKKKRR